MDIKAEYGNTLIDINHLANLRSSGNFNPPGAYPLDESQNWRNISQQLTRPVQPARHQNTSKNLTDRIASYACSPLDQSATFNQRAFHSTQNPYLQLFFNEINVKYIQDRTKKEVKKLRNQDINTEIDNKALQNLMQETFTLAHQGKLPVLKQGSDVCTLKNFIGNLNRQVISRYVKHAISTIDMHKYYLNDITTLPVPLEPPIFTSTKGSNVVSQQVGLGTVEEFNRDIREWNQRFSRFSS